MKIVSGSSNLPFSQSLAQKMGLELVDVELTKFANGENRVYIKEEIRGENIILVQSLSQPTDDHIMETLLLADALERLGARHINVVIPWMGYSLQDKVFREGESIAAKVVANLISTAHIKRALLLDLHNSSTPGFFSIPTHHLSSMGLFADHAHSEHGDQLASGELVIVSPDFGGLKRARVFATSLGVELANVDKHRDLISGQVSAIDVQGALIEGKIAILFDDVILSGGTVIEGARILKERGAREVHFYSTHGLFTGDALEKIKQSPVDSVVITNSIHQKNLPDKIKVIDCASVFAKELADWL